MAIPIYVVNLDRDTERLAAITENLRGFALSFERIPAVLGAHHADDPKIVDFARYPARNRRQTPRNGEVGCYLSHLHAYERLLASRHRWCVVLEDDADCLPTLPGVLEGLDRRDDWDMAKLFCYHGGTPVTVARLGDGSRLCVHLTRTTSTAGYAINRRAAETLLRSLLPMSQQIDHAMDRPWETGLRIRGVHPRPVRLAPTSAATSIGYSDKDAIRQANPRLFAWRATSEACRFVHGVVESARALVEAKLGRSSPGARR